MSAREWKPGDVARIHYGEFDDIAVRLDPRDWAVPAGTVRDASVEIAYPLVVLDPEDREQVTRVLETYGRQFSNWTPELDSNVTRLQNALRSLVAPPKPEEPTGLGAVVEDAEGFLWVRNETPQEPPWRCDHRGWKAWDRVDAVKVLSEGVAQ